MRFKHTGPKYDRSCVFKYESDWFISVFVFGKSHHVLRVQPRRIKVRGLNIVGNHLVGGVYLVSSQFIEVPFEFAPSIYFVPLVMSHWI
jgi:hypothetical protein